MSFCTGCLAKCTKNIASFSFAAFKDHMKIVTAPDGTNCTTNFVSKVFRFFRTKFKQSDFILIEFNFYVIFSSYRSPVRESAVSETVWRLCSSGVRSWSCVHLDSSTVDSPFVSTSDTATVKFLFSDSSYSHYVLIVYWNATTLPFSKLWSTIFKKKKNILTVHLQRGITINWIFYRKEVLLIVKRRQFHRRSSFIYSPRIINILRIHSFDHVRPFFKRNIFENWKRDLHCRFFVLYLWIIQEFELCTTSSVIYICSDDAMYILIRYLGILILGMYLGERRQFQ